MIFDESLQLSIFSEPKLIFFKILFDIILFLTYIFLELKFSVIQIHLNPKFLPNKKIIYDLQFFWP